MSNVEAAAAEKQQQKNNNNAKNLNQNEINY